MIENHYQLVLSMTIAQTLAKKDHRFRVDNLEYRAQKDSAAVGVFEVIAIPPTRQKDNRGNTIVYDNGYDTYKYIKTISVEEARKIYANSKNIVNLILDSSFFMSQTWFTPEGYSKACRKREQEMWTNGIAWNE